MGVRGAARLGARQESEWIWGVPDKLEAAGLVTLADEGYQRSTYAKIPYKGKNKPASLTQANKGARQATVPRRARKRPAQDLAYPPQAPLLPLARRTTRQGHPRIADPRGKRRPKRFTVGVHLGCSDWRTAAHVVGFRRNEEGSRGGVFPGHNGYQVVIGWRPQQDSNLRSRLRRQLPDCLTACADRGPRGLLVHTWSADSQPLLSVCEPTSSVSGNAIGRSCFRILAVSCGVWSADVHGSMPPSRTVVTQLVTRSRDLGLTTWMRTTSAYDDRLPRQ